MSAIIYILFTIVWINLIVLKTLGLINWHWYEVLLPIILFLIFGSLHVIRILIDTTYDSYTRRK